MQVTKDGAKWHGCPLFAFRQGVVFFPIALGAFNAQVVPSLRPTRRERKIAAGLRTRRLRRIVALAIASNGPPHASSRPSPHRNPEIRPSHRHLTTSAVAVCPLATLGLALARRWLNGRIVRRAELPVRPAVLRAIRRVTRGSKLSARRRPYHPPRAIPGSIARDIRRRSFAPRATKSFGRSSPDVVPPAIVTSSKTTRR